MPHENKLIFKYFVDLPDGSRQLRLSSTSVNVRYANVTELNSMAREVVSQRIGITTGSVTVLCPDWEGCTVDRVTEDNIHEVKHRATLTVVIDAADTRD